MKDVWKWGRRKYCPKESDYTTEEIIVEFKYPETICEKIENGWVPVWSNPEKVHSRIEQGTHKIYFEVDQKSYIKKKFLQKDGSVLLLKKIKC